MEPGYWLVPTIYVSYRVGIRRFEHLGGTGERRAVPDVVRPDGDRAVLQPEHPVQRQDIRNTNTFNRGRFPATTSRTVSSSATTRATRSTSPLTRGRISRLYLELADRVLGSSTSYTKFGVDARGYIPLARREEEPDHRDARDADYVSGPSDTPFWERSSLGGRDSLRGYGGDRFIGFNRSVGSRASHQRLPAPPLRREGRARARAVHRRR